MTKSVDHNTVIEKIVNAAGEWLSMKAIAKSARLAVPAAKKALRALVGEKRIQAHGATSSRVYGRLKLAPPTGAPAPRKRHGKKRRAPNPRRAKTLHVKHALVQRLPGAFPIVSFTAAGEILVSGGAGTKVLDVNEVREVVKLVRAFDGAGLLPA